MDEALGYLKMQSDGKIFSVMSLHLFIQLNIASVADVGGDAMLFWHVCGPGFG